MLQGPKSMREPTPVGQRALVGQRSLINQRALVDQRALVGQSPGRPEDNYRSEGLCRLEDPSAKGQLSVRGPGRSKQSEQFRVVRACVAVDFGYKVHIKINTFPLYFPLIRLDYLSLYRSCSLLSRAAKSQT